MAHMLVRLCVCARLAFFPVLLLLYYIFFVFSAFCSSISHQGMKLSAKGVLLTTLQASNILHGLNRLFCFFFLG